MSTMTDTPAGIPLPTIRRYPEYLLVLESWKETGREWVSATELGRELDRKPIVVRKDLALSGVVGSSRNGWPVGELIPALREALGWNNTSDAFLVGVGVLGRALLNYQGFSRYGMGIVAAFDRNPRFLDGKDPEGRIFPPEKLPDLAARMNVSLGIIAVPREEAQNVADLLVENGIRGIWNFAPVNLKVPDSVVVKREDLSLGLAILSYRINGLEGPATAGDR